MSHKTPVEEAEELRAATREMHEAMKDGKGLLREMRETIAELRQTAELVFTERMDAQVAAGMERYSASIDRAIAEADAAVDRRFSILSGVLLGEIGREGEPTMFDYARTVAGMRGLDRAPLPENVGGDELGMRVGHEDGRVCAYHERLGLWVINPVEECLREHPDPHESIRKDGGK